MRSAALLLAGVLQLTATAAQSAELPANQWVKLEEGGIGVRTGGALLYVPHLKRFMVAMGAQTRYDRKPTPPYSEMTFDVEKRRWENALPEAGAGWGKSTGPVEAPKFGRKIASGLHKDSTGLLRPQLRGGYGTQVYHLFAYDTDRKKVLYGVDMEYDPLARLWRKLETKGHPGTPNPPSFEIATGPVMPVWSQTCYDPVNKEIVLFGGTKVANETATPGTWLYSAEKNEWRRLRSGSETVNTLAAKASVLQKKAHEVAAACRNRYYLTELAENRKQKLSAVLEGILKAGEIQALLEEAKKAAASAKGHGKQQLDWAVGELAAALGGYKALLAAARNGIDAKGIAGASEVRKNLRRATTSLSPEPPARCYSQMVFDEVSQRIILFGGSGLSHAKADTWLYDPETRSWEERRPTVNPSPRLGHGLVYLPKAKKVALVGGWVGKSGWGCTAFIGSALAPEIWTYDVKGDKWSLIKRWKKPTGKRAEHPVFPSPGNAPQFFAADENDVIVTLAGAAYRKPAATWACRVDATASDVAGTAKHGAGPGAERYPGSYCSPEWYDAAAPPPDAKKTEAELKGLPVNKWMRRSEGGLKRPNFAYCSVAYDPDRDQIITYAGGHGTWHGTDVGRYSLATDRWHTDHYAHIPLTFGYFATGGSYGYGFRPWMPVHTWNGYSYDTATRKLVILAGMPGFTFTYDFEAGAFDRPEAKLPPIADYKSSKTAVTPMGLCAWIIGKNKAPWLGRFDAEKKAWVALPVKGKLAKPYCDTCNMTYDSKRNRLILLPAGLKGDLLAYDLKTGTLEHLKPKGKENAPSRFRECRYVAGQDLIFDMMGSAYLIEKNEWVKLKIDTTELFKKGGKRGRPTAAYNSQAMIHDTKRDLLWAVNGYSNKGVFVMKLDPAKARNGSK